MDLNKEIYSTCFNPQKIKVYSQIKQTYEELEVPCGKCYHCIITKVNEWVTRMTAQSLYSKNTYYVTLTYDSALYGTKFFSQTSPVIHAFNEFGRKMPAPLTLNKKHLQDFFKRLRKNTKVKFQYFACGEYGDNYSRPHYHFILWSDQDISPIDIQNAWSIYEDGKRYFIGQIDFQDLNKDSINPEHPYKYVCKYLQKREFDFTKLKTFKYHYANYKRNYEGVSIKTAQGFDDYSRIFSPFFLCSKRPSIGLSYFEENKARFKQQDFRLFNLPTGSVFPSYYFRKTRESICPFKTISTTNFKPKSFSDIPQVVSLLHNIEDCIEFNEGFSCYNPTYEYISYYNFGRAKNDPYASDILLDGKTIGQDCVRFVSNNSIFNKDVVLPKKYFDFYDVENKYYYSLASDFKYNVLDSKKNLIYSVSISDVIKEVSYRYSKLLSDFLIPNKHLSDFKKEQKLLVIENEYGSYNNFLEVKKNSVTNLLHAIEQRQSIYKQSKNKF